MSLLAPEREIQVLNQAREPRERVEKVAALALALCQWNQLSSLPTAVVRAIDINYVF